MKDQIIEWLDGHSRDYELTEMRLSFTRSKFMDSDIDTAADMLHKSYVNAVISQQTPVDRHEAGFIHYVETGEIPEYVNYQNQKTQWINSTNHIHERNVVRMLQSNADIDTVHDYLVTHFVGLAEMKAAFTLAMLGFTSRMCVDTNVAQICDIDNRNFRNLDQYLDVCDTIHQKFDNLNLSPFMTQWVLFDYNRGNHSTHEVFYRELGTWITPDKQVWRNKL